MKGILILAHGSREKETIGTMEKISAMVGEKLPQTPIETAYLQFCDDTLRVGLDRLTARGVDEITVVPYFLFDGLHIRHDIPEEIGLYLNDHPGVTVRVGKTLGADARLAQVLTDRIRQAL